MAKIGNILKEARRRRVFRVAALYIVGAWVFLQVADLGFPALGIPEAAIRYVWLGALLAFPVAIVFGWLYDITPTGIQRTLPLGTNEQISVGLRRADYVILAALAAVSIAIVVDLSSRLRGAGNPARPALAPAANAIAVLPFDNLTADAELEYFVNGMHAAVINRLSGIGSLRVTSKTSTLAYAQSPQAAPVISEQLGVTWLVEGGVYRSGDEVRIDLRLVDAVSDTSAWSRELEGSLANVLRLQSEAARLIARQIEVELTNDEIARFAAAGTVVPAAYDAYLRGRFHMELFTPEDMQRALRFFEHAVELDPDFALAYTGLSGLCRFRLQAGLVRPREWAPRCTAPLLQALALDDERAEIYSGLALGHWLYDYDWEAAEAAFRRALEINPNFAEARMFYSHFLMNLARCDESAAEMRIARELDPLNPFVRGLDGAQRAGCGATDEATAEGLDLIAATIDAHPQLGFGYDVLWWAGAGIGRLEQSFDAARKHFSITMNRPEVSQALDRGYEDSGYQGAMLAAADVLAELWHQTYIPAYEISMSYALGGDIDNYLKWIDVAYEEHDPTLPYLGAIGRYAPGSDDPRIQRVLARMKLEQWADAKPD